MQEKKYEEIGTNYRFFLGWRHASFVGILVVFYGVISLTLESYGSDGTGKIAWIIPLLASPVGLLLWGIDVRLRDLYHATIRAGKALEGEGGGFYTELTKEVMPPASDKKKKKKKKFTHSKALEILFIGSSVVSFLVSIVLLWSPW